VSTEVIWHDVECGSYVADLPVWRELADEADGPILDVGAGTGRVAIALGRAGHRVTALDRDAELLAELERRAAGLELETAVADARSFDLKRRFALCLVPMQTIQLLGGREQRAAFLRCARTHLQPDGVLAAAVADVLEPYDTGDGGPAPLPDMLEREGIVYSSFPTAIREEGDGFVIERRREIVYADGSHESETNVIRLDRLAAAELEREALAAGMRRPRRGHVPPTEDHVGSEVVIVHA
jgi:SAM-dependent methyltransferase